MNVSDECERRRRQVDSWLGLWLPPSETRPSVLHRAMRHSVLAGGKRLRPILALATAEALGGSPGTAARSACAIELFHTYTLVHDDLPCMDDDDLRRGVPTCHVVFGEANALLAGDALLTLAFEWLAGGPNAAACVLELATCGGSQGVVGGQVEDLAAEGKPADADTLAYIHSGKTARLLRAALRIGGLCGGASPDELERLGRFGDHLGLAFQIVDDILDETSTNAELGKPVGSDRANAKMTYVTLHGLEGANAEAERLTAAALAELDGMPRGDWRLIRGIAGWMLRRTR